MVLSVRGAGNVPADRGGQRFPGILAHSVELVGWGDMPATDGPVRDYVGIVPVGLPVWCAGLTPASPHMSGPGSVGFPIQIGGQEIETGDMIVADRDGVVVVPFERIDEVIQKLAHISELEKSLDGEVAQGLKVPSWVEAYLASDKTVRKG